MEIGKSAPGFELYDQSDNLYRLSDSLGAWVVLFFYPKDNTPGCTAEVCDFNSEYDRLLVLVGKAFRYQHGQSSKSSEVCSKTSIEISYFIGSAGKGCIGL